MPPKRKQPQKEKSAKKKGARGARQPITIDDSSDESFVATPGSDVDDDDDDDAAADDADDATAAPVAHSRSSFDVSKERMERLVRLGGSPAAFRGIGTRKELLADTENLKSGSENLAAQQDVVTQARVLRTTVLKAGVQQKLAQEFQKAFNEAEDKAAFMAAHGCSKQLAAVEAFRDGLNALDMDLAEAQSLKACLDGRWGADGGGGGGGSAPTGDAVTDAVRSVLGMDEIRDFSFPEISVHPTSDGKASVKVKGPPKFDDRDGRRASRRG